MGYFGSGSGLAFQYCQTIHYIILESEIQLGKYSFGHTLHQYSMIVSLIDGFCRFNQLSGIIKGECLEVPLQMNFTSI